MSGSLMVELQNTLLKTLQDGLAECAQRETTSHTVFTEWPVVGLFRVRRKVDISPKLQQIVIAILNGEREIRIDGVRIIVPTSRRYRFEVPLPVFVAVAGIEIDVSVRSLELVDEGGQPAVLVTTESSLKPDMLVVLSVGPDEDPDRPEPTFPIDDLADRAIYDLKMPSQYQDVARRAIRHAWQRGIAQDVVKKMLPRTGFRTSRRQTEAAAKKIVEQLVEQRVVNAGLMFWFRLGYWLVKIVIYLIEMQNDETSTTRVTVSRWA